MRQAKSEVLLHDNKALTTSEFFTALINLANKHSIELLLEYNGIKQEQEALYGVSINNLFGGLTEFSYCLPLQTWRSQVHAGKRIILYDTLAIKKDRLQYGKDKIISTSDLVTHVEAVALFGSRGRYIVAVVNDNDDRKLYKSDRPDQIRSQIVSEYPNHPAVDIDATVEAAVKSDKVLHKLRRNQYIINGTLDQSSGQVDKFSQGVCRMSHLERIFNHLLIMFTNDRRYRR